MKTAVIVSDLIVALLLLSTLICGVWMAKQPVVDPSSVSFHMTIGISAVIAVTIALIISTFAVFQAI